MIKITHDDIKKMVKEAIERIMLEEGIGVGQFPKEGYCLIIAGSPGSGKSYLRDHSIPIYGKSFDLDAYREKYEKYLLNVKKMRKTTTTKNGEKILGAKDKAAEDAPSIITKSKNMFFNDTNRRVKDNVIFDVSGGKKQKEPMSLIDEIINMVKPLGYKIGVIWVVTNRSVAMQRNLQRSRTIGDQGFHNKTNQANKHMPKFLTGIEKGSLSRFVDDAWIVFNSGRNLNDKEVPKTIHLDKTENGFNIPEEMMNYLNDFLGPNEKKPSLYPQTYLSNSEIKKNNPSGDTYLR